MHFRILGITIIYFIKRLSTLYLGLDFTSIYIFPIYSPITPIPINMEPPINQREIMREAHPCTVLWLSNATRTQTEKTSAIKTKAMPTIINIRTGLIEKLVIPSIAKFNIRRIGYLLSPAKRAERS